MSENGHKRDFPSRDDIRDFLRTLQPDAPSMFRALSDVSIGAVDKWYRDTEKGGNQISATNLLRVVIALRAEKRFYEWLLGFRPGMRRAQRSQPRSISQDAEQAASDE